MGIAEKLRLAAHASRYVQKDSANAFHKYRYASAANVLEHVNDALHGVGLAVVGTSPKVVSTEGAGKDRIVTVEMTLTVADTESDERATFIGLGSGMDAGDKAVMKAQTAALKYAWLAALSISTGDDPEADETTDKRGAQQPKSSPRSNPKPSRAEAVSPRAPSDAAEPASDEVPAALEEFFTRLQELELPGEGTALWRRHRLALHTLTVPQREAAWRALCERVEGVGKMKNAKVWLKKAIAEEDARSNGGGPSDHQAA